MKILGIGNALMDALLTLKTDDTLKEIGIEKGAMDLIDEEKMIQIQKSQASLERSEVPGGSVSNTIRALANLGAEVGYIGKIGSDSLGKLYEKATLNAGVTPHFVFTEGISGCSTVLISPDGERSMATFLGPAATLQATEISDEILKAYDCIYIEGYLISNDALFLPILERSKKLGLKIVLDLSNFNIVNGFKPLLLETIPKYVDILFSNESEAESFTGLKAEDAVRKISELVEISTVTIGKEGALVGSKGEFTHVPAYGGKPLDTTGAGDNFAAGFLYGLSTNSSLKQAAEIGSLLAGNVIDVIGPIIPADRWAQIKLKVNEIV